MAKAISIQDFYNRREAFHDSDPMIRIAAIHRAGNKLERNLALKETLLDLLDDKDPLIARYAAITLAQSGEPRGLSHIVEAISHTDGQDRQELDNCLRNCVRFPFAVVLNERIFVETIPAVKDKNLRAVLAEALRLTSNSFYEKSEGDSSFRDTFLNIITTLDRLDGLRARDRSVSDVGWVVSAPMGKQPGFLCCPTRRLFLKFQEESVLNRAYMERGRQVIFVAREEAGSGEADCLYVLEDVAPRKDTFTSEMMTRFERKSGLLPGVIVSKWDSPDRVDVLCANGTSFHERYRAQKAFPGQFVLIEEETEMGRPQCHFIPGVRLTPNQIRGIIIDYADLNNLVLAKLVNIHDETHPKTGHSHCIVKSEDGEEIATYIPSPRPHQSVLMKPCHVCEAFGAIACEGCDGQGEIVCRKCSGTLRIPCDRCSGSGTFTCPVCSGTGKAKCKVCKGSGRNLKGSAHRECNGTGKVPCSYCSSFGRKACGTCHGDAELTCDVCGESGRVQCHRCRGAKMVRCPYCQGSRLIFHAKVDCLRA